MLEKANSQRTAALCATIMNIRPRGKGDKKMFRAADFLREGKKAPQSMTAKQALTRMMAWGASVKAVEG